MQSFLRAFALTLFVCLLGIPQTEAQPFFDIELEKIDDPMIGGSADWIDFNADGNLDLFLTGRGEPQLQSSQDHLYARVYRHLGIVGALGGAAHRVFEHDLDVGVWMSDAAWGDYDGDGDLDLFLCGASDLEPPYAPIARLYRFGGAFPMELVQQFDGIYGCTADWGDYDNDGDLDLFASGVRSPDQYAASLYKNSGGILTPVESGLPVLAFGAVRWADADNDADLDLAYTGMAADGSFRSEVYLNDGGVFRPSGSAMTGVAYGSVDWGDVDNDSDLDLLVSGGAIGPMLVEPHTAVYLNDGSGRFSDAGYGLSGRYGGSAVWGDWDNDGDLDFFDAGSQVFLRPEADIYENTGSTLRRVSNPCPVPPGNCLPFEGVTLGSALVFDVDNDHDLDLMLIGLDADRQRFLQIDRSAIVNIPAPDLDIMALNVPPIAPDELTSEIQGNSVTLSWDAAADIIVPGSLGRTPSEGLSYNLRVGTTPGGTDVMPPMSVVATGKRQVVRVGNVGSNLRWHLTLAPGTYYWSVQAIDHSFAGSAFAEEATFVIP